MHKHEFLKLTLNINYYCLMYLYKHIKWYEK